MNKVPKKPRPEWAKNLPTYDPSQDTYRFCALEGNDRDKMLAHTWHSCRKCTAKHLREIFGKDGFWNPPADEDESSDEEGELAESSEIATSSAEMESAKKRPPLPEGAVVAPPPGGAGDNIKRPRPAAAVPPILPINLLPENMPGFAEKTKKKPSPYLEFKAQEKVRREKEVRELAEKDGISLKEAKTRWFKLELMRKRERNLPSRDPESSTADEDPNKRNLPSHQRCYLPSIRYDNDKLCSLLTADQHKLYIARALNIRNVGSVDTPGQKAEFKRWKAMLDEEHVAFNEFVREKFFTPNQVRARFGRGTGWCAPGIDDYCREMIESKMSKLPERNFEMRPIATVATAETGLHLTRDWLERDCILIEIGKFPRIIMPDQERKAVVPEEYADVAKKFPADRDSRVPLSEETNIEMLMSKHNATIVSSTSSFRHLLTMDSLTHGLDWDMQITIGIVRTFGQTRKIVFLEKVLPPRQQSLKQKTWYFMKYALRAKVVDKKFDVEKARELSQKGKQRNAQEAVEPEIFEGVTDYEHLETFGVVSSPKKRTGDEVGIPVAPADSDLFGSVSSSSAAESPVEVPKKRGRGRPKKTEKLQTPAAKSKPKTPVASGGRNVRNGRNVQKNAGSLYEITSEELLTSQQASERKELEEEGNGELMIVEEATPDAQALSGGSTKIPEKVTTLPNSTSPSKVASGTGELESTMLSPGQLGLDVMDSIMSGWKESAASLLDETDTDETDSGVDVKMKIPPEDHEGKYQVESNGTNRRYTVWNLKDMQILVRSKYDGRCTYKVGKHKGKQHRASLLPKVEYLYDHGGQAFTDSEFIYHWATTVLKGVQTHYVGRIASRGRDILAMQDIKIQEFQNKNNLSQHRARLLEQRLRILHRILQQLSMLMPGNYLLRSRSDEEGVLKICRELPETYLSQGVAGQQVCFSVRDLYKDSGRKEIGVPKDITDYYIPIDPEVILQWHKIKKQIPATFRPRRETESATLRCTMKRGRKKGKKKKGNKGKKVEEEKNEDLEEMETEKSVHQE